MTRYQKILLIIFLAVFVWSALFPESISEWILESTPVILAAIAVILVGRKYKLSNLSYTLLSLYFCLALLPAHYNVSQVPFGFVLGHLFGSDRNMYDRLLHFLLGFFCTGVFYELCLQIVTKKYVWSYAIPFATVMSFSAIYEILEWLAGIFADPKVSITFAGAQGDLWDPAKDMATAALGGIIAIVILVAVHYRKRVTVA